jgi:hypothetical protein
MPVLMIRGTKPRGLLRLGWVTAPRDQQPVAQWRATIAAHAGCDCANGYRFAKWQGKPNVAIGR